jgi:hypothetical protein
MMVSITISLPEDVAVEALQKRAFEPENLIRLLRGDRPLAGTLSDGASPSMRSTPGERPSRPDPFRCSSDDERRLLVLFRSLESDHERSEILEEIAEGLMKLHFPDASTADFMPKADGLVPDGEIGEPWSSRNNVWEAIEAAGDSRTYLLGSSAWDREHVVPLFLARALRQIDEGFSWYRIPDEAFLGDYLTTWRWSIVNQLADAAATARQSQDDDRPPVGQ